MPSMSTFVTMASSSHTPLVSALHLKKVKQQEMQQPQQQQHPHIPLLSSKHLASHQEVILQQRERSRQRRCSQLLETVLESLTTFRQQEDRSSSIHSHHKSCPCTKMKGSASPALTSYFHTISMEQELFDIDECRVVVDNAHIPLDYLPRKEEEELQVQDSRAFHERMSRSLSDIPAVSFPPEWLYEDNEDPHSPACRWESFNSSSSSGDFSLSVPTRTQDADEDRSSRKPVDEPTPPTPPLRGKRRHVAPAVSLDSTARLLRQLPLDSSSHSASTHSSSSRFARSEAESTEDLQDMPVLSTFNPFESHIETHPRAAKRRLSEESLDLSGSFQSVEDESSLFSSSDGEREEEKVDSNDSQESFDQDQQSSNESSVAPSLHPVSFDRWSVYSPSKSLSKHCISLGKAHETPTTDWSAKNLNFLTHQVSPRILADFPLAPSFSSSYKLPDDEGMGEIFQTTERILDLRSSYKQG